MLEAADLQLLCDLQELLEADPHLPEGLEVLANRVECSARLIRFTQATFPQYIPELFHQYLAGQLDRVRLGEIDRLIVSAPPQHGKSELVSIRFPAMWLGSRPNDPVVITSYAASLALSKSRQARQCVESSEFREIFPGVTTDRESRAVDHWSLAAPHRGSFLAVGVGGPITGHGAMLGVVDDPFENWKQAQSQTIRSSVWDWYRTTFRTRIWEGGSIVIVMTRWHEDDLVGRLLEDQSDRWNVIRLPAMAENQEERDENDRYLGLSTGQLDPLGREPGAPLCPVRFSSQALVELKNDVGAMGWAAEYQGVPRAPEGNLLKREQLPIVDTVTAGPEMPIRIRYWDFAATEGGGAYSAGVRIALHPDFVVIEDVVRGQWSTQQRRDIMYMTATQDAHEFDNNVRIYFEQEGGSAGKDAAYDTTWLLRGFPIEPDRVSGSKDTRMLPFIGQAQMGRVRVLRGAWNYDYRSELLALPNSTYRDQADATSGAFNKASRLLRTKSGRRARSRQG